MQNEGNIPLEELVGALLDKNQPLPAKFLYRFSDITQSELDIISDMWANIAIERRQGLLEDLETLEESNTLISFNRICRLALNDEDARVRKIAIRALWNYEDPDLIPTFMDMLINDSSVDVRAQAANGLGRFIYLGELEQISPDNVKPIEEKLLAIMDGEEEETLRLRALESLGYSSRESVSDLIEEAYQFGDENWVASALFAMGRSADEDWTHNVLDKLDDPVHKVRLEAIRAAGELSLEAATPALLYLLEGEDDELRPAAAWALSEIGAEDARDALENLLLEMENEDEIDLIEDALENLTLTEEMESFNLLDFSEEALEDLQDSPPQEDSQY
jgi:HEAT repeat protein